MLYVYNYVRAVRNASDPSANDDLIQPLRLNIYPNPVTGVCTLSLEKNSESAVVDLYNLRGALVTRQNFSNTRQFQLDMSNLPSGIYFVKVKSNTTSSTTKLLKL